MEWVFKCIAVTFSVCLTDAFTSASNWSRSFVVLLVFKKGYHSLEGRLLIVVIFVACEPLFESKTARLCNWTDLNWNQILWPAVAKWSADILFLVPQQNTSETACEKTQAVRQTIAWVVNLPVVSVDPEDIQAQGDDKMTSCRPLCVLSSFPWEA